MVKPLAKLICETLAIVYMDIIQINKPIAVINFKLVTSKYLLVKYSYITLFLSRDNDSKTDQQYKTNPLKAKYQNSFG